MSSSRGLTQDEEIIELNNEIYFQEVMLESLGDQNEIIDDREEAISLVQAEIKTLRSRLRALMKEKHRANHSSGHAGDRRSHLGQHVASVAHKTPARTRTDRTPGTHTSSKKKSNPVNEIEDTMDSDPGAESEFESFHRPTSAQSGSTVSDQTLALETNNTSPASTDQLNLVQSNRKRSRHVHLDKPSMADANKSRRTTPSSFASQSRASTPVSSSEDETFTNFMSLHREAAREAELRAEQEKADAEFARSLLDNDLEIPDWLQDNNVDMSTSGPQSTFRSTTAGPDAVPTRRALPWTQAIKQEPQPSKHTVFAPVFRQKAPATGSSYIQSEGSSSRPMPGSFPLKMEFEESEDDSVPFSSRYSLNNQLSNGSKAQDDRESMAVPISYAFSQSSGNSQSYLPAIGHVYSSSSSSASQDIFPGSSYRRKFAPSMLNPPSDGRIVIDLTGDSDRESYLGDLELEWAVSGGKHEFNGEAFDLAVPPHNDRNAHREDDHLESLLANIRPDEDLPVENREGTPDGLKYPLYEHQKLALTWLKSQEESAAHRGGILADDMGLGKTISALALILARPSSDHARKTTLIVGPVALIRQWEREIQTKINFQHRLSTLMMHGRAKGRKLSWDDIRVYDIVLTTYGTLSAECLRMERYITTRNLRPDLLDQVAMSKEFPLLSGKSIFHRVILDEAQCIKNKLSRSAKACFHLKATHRLCLTGTPMMNTVGELYSLILFLGIKPYNQWARFRMDFGPLFNRKANHRDHGKAMQRLQVLLKAILLRRVKKSLIDGKPIITLPPKVEEVQHVVFDDDEQAFYQALESKTQLQFSKYLKKGTVGRNYSNVLVLLLRLRQACCHPHLIQDFEQAPTELAEEDLITLAKSLNQDVVDRILAADDSFECPICYDGVPNPAILIPCGHDCCSECLSRLSDQATRDNLAQGEDARGKSKCPACRTPIDTARVIDYTTFKKVYKETPEEDIETASEHSDSESDTDSEVSGSETDSDDDDVNSNGDLRDFIVQDDVEEAEDEENSAQEEEAGDDDDDFAAPSSGHEAAQKKNDQKRKKGKKPMKSVKGKEVKRSQKGKKKQKAHVSLAMLKKEASKSASGRRRYMSYLRKKWQPSSKVTKCIELLERFQMEDQKTIVFSQFVSLLDLIQVPVEDNKWAFERYDGSMSAEARHNAIMRFTDSPNCKIMFISLKAGNAGLNLVAASRVIILDPFWNPYVEMQAIDRAYRIGQQRSVEVHRILVKGTVEDRIIELQESKRKMVDAALDENGAKSASRLGVEQFKFLFGFGGGAGN